MNVSSDAKHENQEPSLDDQVAFFESESKSDPIYRARAAAPNRSVRVHPRSANASIEIGLSPKQHRTDGNPKSPKCLLENTKARRGVQAKVTERAETTRIHQPVGIPVRLTGHFVHANAVLLIIPAQTDAVVSVRRAMRAIYAIFQSKGSNLTFRPSSEHLRCSGYFTNNFDTCAFEAQILSVPPSFAVSDQPDEHICELRRSSYGGRGTFNVLLRAVAIGLKRAGHAKHWANGFEIYPEHSIDDDLYSMPSRSSTAKYPISLDSENVSRLSSIVAKRINPLHCETLRLLAKCSAGSKENREILLESDELGEAVLRELSHGSDADACLNSLKLIKLGATAPKEAFTGIARSMVVFCGNQPTGYKGMRSQAIENSALGAMEVLMRSMQKEERERSLQTVEKVLSGKVGENLLCEMQTICLGKC